MQTRHFFETHSNIFNLNGLNFINVNYYGKNIKLLLDTGASVSVFFKNNLHENQNINEAVKVKINGISGSINSHGSVNVLFRVDDIPVNHTFLLIDNFSHYIDGVIGTDFFLNYYATINYETFTFSFYYNNEKIIVPIQANYELLNVIPKRTEIIKYVDVDCSQDCVIFPDEICEGIFVAGSIVTPNLNNKIPIKFLNTRDQDVCLKNFKPKIDSLENYEFCSFGYTDNHSVERADKLLELINLDHLRKEEKFSLQKICAKYSDVFLLDNDPLTTSNIYQQKIYLKPNAIPSYKKPYRLPFSQKKEIDQQIDKMLRDGVIEEAKSEWSSPILLVPKKVDKNGNRSFRLVVDYRGCNSQLQDEKWPLPCITDILDSLSGATYFSHLDLSQGYYQVELEKSSRPYTAFTVGSKGQYQMTRLPMGLKISPSAFSRAMTIAMSGLNYESCFVYLDDLIVFGRNFEQHNINLIRVLQRLREVNLKLNPNKCDFLKKELLYLGHVVSEKGVLPDPEKIKIVEEFPIPKDANEVKRFVAFANYYRKYIKNFAEIAAPLNYLSRKNIPFQWTEENQKSFEHLKKSLISPPILQYPNFSPENTFILKTDASGHSVGAVLSNGDDRPVAYASRALNKAEKRYSTIEKELLAIVFGIKHFSCYLYGRKFIIFTDHRPLIYLFGMANPSSRLTKFRMLIEEYDFEIRYIKGRNNVVADCLSRKPLSSDDLKQLGNTVTETINVMTRQQRKCLNQTGNKENLDTSLSDRLDHPGAVEVLRHPKNSYELSFITREDFNLLLEKKIHIDLKVGKFNFIEKQKVIYIIQDPRSAFVLGTSLRDLDEICKKRNIPELVVLKNKINAQLLIEIKSNISAIKKCNFKIIIIRDVQKINDIEKRKIILNDFHTLPTGGHAGINRMYNNIKKYYFWPGLRLDVEDFVKRCDDCQRYKHSRPNVQPMSITTTASSAFQNVYLDLVGPLDEDNEGNKYILTLQCELSKFVECCPLPNKESAQLARAFVNNFILRYGIPKSIITDQGTEFLSEVLKETCKILKIKQLHSTAYHHETIGSLENSHKNLNAYLRIQIARNSGFWSSWLPFWSFSFNNTVHTETKYTPYELVFGKICVLPSNIINNVDPLYNFDSYPHELKYRLQNAWADARSNLNSAKEKRKAKFDLKTKFVSYSIGDKILVRNDAGSKKDAIFNGPYTVVEDRAPNVIVKIGNKLVEIHKNRTKLYTEK